MSREKSMRTKFMSLGLLLALLALAAGCSPGNVVVLMPDPDGKVGQVSVSNQGGSQTLTKAGQATFIRDGQTAPAAPVVMKKTEIQERFGEALAARPSPPVSFLLYFHSDSTKLVDASKTLLPKIIAAIKERESVDVSVVGHCDTVGDDDYNLRLSRRRAMAVAKMLTKSGVDPKTLEITSHGKRRPLIPTGDNVREPRNRRVEVTVR
jgi:outer membrane protein OmpA-like peptidoglycan-associated protein